jgi:hypothetical protein
MMLIMEFDRLPPVSFLKGAKLRDVEARDYDWAFVFDNEVGIVAEKHWRLLNAEALVVTDEDHGHPFGLKQPVDAASVLQDALSGATVDTVKFRSPPSDLLLSFSNGCTLEVLVGSLGYESWHVHGPDGSHTLADGGGRLCHWAS